MTALIKTALRDSAAKQPADGKAGPESKRVASEKSGAGLWWRVEREIIPLLREMRKALNVLGPGFGDEVNITTAQSPYAVLPTDEFIRANATNGPIVILLLPAEESTVRFLSVKKVAVDVSGNAVTPTARLGEDIDGAPVAPVTAAETFIRLYGREGGYDIA